VRDYLLEAPQISLRDLGRHDWRIAAHLDGVAIAGDVGWAMCQELLESVGPGELFVATVRALHERETDRLRQVLAVAAAVDEAWRGATSAFGWVSGNRLSGIVKSLVASDDAVARLIGITACALHRVDPGVALRRQLADDAPRVRSRVYRTVGELGRSELVSELIAARAEPDAECRFWAAWSSVLLGNRGTMLALLTEIASAAGPHHLKAFRLALQAMDTGAAHQLLRHFAEGAPNQLRWLIQGTGIAGDSIYCPWLIGHMNDPAMARVAGEAFSLITGVDVWDGRLDREQHEAFEARPDDEPESEDVDIDADEGLPWPDPKKVEAWWAANSREFQPGTRYFMGAPVTTAHCRDVLKRGYQRQRIVAANYLCLLEPGTPLFNTSAPAWRQQRLLAKMA
jgi:uncharacterized protein (TIGR02270 family)